MPNFDIHRNRGRLAGLCFSIVVTVGLLEHFGLFLSFFGGGATFLMVVVGGVLPDVDHQDSIPRKLFGELAPVVAILFILALALNPSLIPSQVGSWLAIPKLNAFHDSSILRNLSSQVEWLMTVFPEIPGLTGPLPGVIGVLGGFYIAKSLAGRFSSAGKMFDIGTKHRGFFHSVAFAISAAVFSYIFTATLLGVYLPPMDAEIFGTVLSAALFTGILIHLMDDDEI